MENGIEKLKKSLTNSSLDFLGELIGKRDRDSRFMGFSLDLLLEKTGFTKEDLENYQTEYGSSRNNKALIRNKLDSIPFSNWQNGIEDYFKTYELIPPFYRGFPSSLQRWDLVRESFMEVFPIEIYKKPKTITQISKENNSSKQQLTTQIRSLKYTLSINLVPQLIEHGKYISPWFEKPKEFVDLPKLTKFVGIRGINALFRGCSYEICRDFSKERLPIFILMEECNKYKIYNSSWSRGVGEKSIKGIEKYLDSLKN